MDDSMSTPAPQASAGSKHRRAAKGSKEGSKGGGFMGKFLPLVLIFCGLALVARRRKGDEA